MSSSLCGVIASLSKVGNISTDRDGNISTDRDGNISNDRDGNISNDRDGNISTDRDGNISTDRDGNISNDRDGNISTDRDGNISTDRDGNISTDRDGNISNDRDGNISTDRDGNISNDRDGNIFDDLDNVKVLKANLDPRPSLLWVRIVVRLDEIMNKDLIKENIKVISSEMFTTDPEDSALDLKKNDARIIIGSMYDDKARMLLCAIYNHTPEEERPNAWYKKVVWLFPNMLFKHWMEIHDAKCSPDQMQEVLGNYFTIGSQIIYRDVNYAPDSGITDFNVLLNGTLLYHSVESLMPNEFQKHYTTGPNGTFYSDGSLSGQHRAPQAYDAVWAITLALNNTLTHLKQTGDSKKLEDFEYHNAEFSRMLHEGMRNVTFNALSGPFQFNRNGERSHNIVIYQYNRDIKDSDKFVGVGSCKKDNETDTWNCGLNKHLIVWPEGKPPADGVLRKTILINIRCKYKYVFWSLSCLGVLLTCTLLVFNVSKRNHRIIKMSSPNINNVILIGCLAAYSTIFITDFAWKGADIACVFLKDGSLFLIVVTLVIVNSSILIGWAVASPQYPTLVNISTTPPDHNNDVEYINQYQRCDSKYRIHFMFIILAIQGIVILFGTFLAFQTRKVTCPELNDSRWIALCIYNVVVLCPIGVVVVIATVDKPEVNYALEASMTILVTSMTECLIFVPKKRIKSLKEANYLGKDGPSPDLGHSKDPGFIDADLISSNTRVLFSLSQNMNVQQ
ncbi:hypothetical protein Btru_049494 [Bulinus truncatus]|nr:hypothetical protein Btru_049494 [Bulinus truncatus]